MRYPLICYLSLVILGCQSVSKKQNHPGAQGLEKQDALYLQQVHNLVLLTQKLSELAMGEAELRSTYLLAEETYTLANELREEFKTKAGSQNLSLENELSTQNAQYLIELQQIPEEDFDKVYHQHMRSNLSRIIALSNDYLKYGLNESLLGFAGTLKNQMTELNGRFQPVDSP